MTIVLEFTVLLAIITFAAWLLSIGAERLAEKYGANFTGSIVLALITTLPEYMFVIFAALKGKYAMAIGSAIGSCSLLITLGYGSVILLATTRASRKPVEEIKLSAETRYDAIYLAVTAVIAFLLAWWGDGFGLVDGIILCALFLGYVYHMARVAYEYHRRHKAAGKKQVKGFWRGIACLVGGGVVIFFATEPFVDSMIKFSVLFGISPVTIAIVIGPIASEMPEKLTAFLTVIRDGKLAEISIANFIGSKVNHNSLLLGTLALIAVFHGGMDVAGVITPSFIFMTVITLIATASLARRRLCRRQGVFFLLLYVAVVLLAFQEPAQIVMQ